MRVLGHGLSTRRYMLIDGIIRFVHDPMCHRQEYDITTSRYTLQKVPVVVYFYRSTALFRRPRLLSTLACDSMLGLRFFCSFLPVLPTLLDLDLAW